MQIKTFLTITLLIVFSAFTSAQTENHQDTTALPVIEYSNISPKYQIADIKVTGASNYEDYVLIGYSGLSVGDVVEIPGEAISNAVKKFMIETRWTMWQHSHKGEFRGIEKKVDVNTFNGNGKKWAEYLEEVNNW